MSNISREQLRQLFPPCRVHVDAKIGDDRSFAIKESVSVAERKLDAAIKNGHPTVKFTLNDDVPIIVVTSRIIAIENVVREVAA
jgi:hypothetical protein